VLKVDAGNSMLTEKNPLLKPYIYKKLAPGIYLLTVTNDSQAAEFTEKTGLDFVGSIQTVKKDILVSGFAPLADGVNYFETKSVPSSSASGQTDREYISEKNRNVFINGLCATLDAMDMDDMQRECFADRIRRKIILDGAQLNTGSVHAEVIEARGMDFLGKVRVIEKAISSGNMIKLTYDSDNEEQDKSPVDFFGKPLEIKKSESDAAAVVRLEPDQTVRLFSIGQAASVKRIRGSLFTELDSEL
jgi:hypothetical protein